MAESYSHFPTANEIIISAFELLRVYDANASNVPITSQYTRAIQALNFMLTAWQSDGLQLWARKTSSFALTQGTTSYSVGSGGTIDINRPLKIYNAWRQDTSRSENIDIPIEVLSEDKFYSLANKETEGTPIAIYYDPRYESNSVQEGSTAKGLIYVYQPADATNATNSTIYFRYQRPFNDFTDTSDTLDFPQEWNEAIKFGLAVRLAFVYGTPMLEYDRLKKMADEAKEQAMGFDMENHSFFIQPDTKWN